MNSPSSSFFFLIKFNCRKLITNEFWSPLSSDLQGKPGVACLTEGSGAWEWDLIYRQPTAKTSLSSPRTSSVLFGWHLPRGNLQCLPSDCVSSNGDAQKTEPSFQPRRTPDRPLLFLQRAPDFALLPLPAWLTWIALLKKNKKVIAIESTGGTRETHCVLSSYLWWMQHLVIYPRFSGKERDFYWKGTQLFGTKEMDQGEANVCIWQDTDKAK